MTTSITTSVDSLRIDELSRQRGSRERLREWKSKSNEGAFFTAARGRRTQNSPSHTQTGLADYDDDAAAAAA
eukprot:2762552-Pyramimonas_sp.AAC.1